MKKSTAPKGIDWSRVDLTRPVRDLVAELGVHRSVVYEARKRRSVKPVTTQPTAALAREMSALDMLAELAGSSSVPSPAHATSRPHRASKRRDDGITHAIVASDIHFPDEDRQAYECFLRRVDDAEPDVLVLAGDILELEAGSRHGGVPQPRMLVDEIRYAREQIARMRDMIPDARIVYLEGNHETRLQRAVVDALPTFHGALDIPSLLDLSSVGVEWMRYGQVLGLGHLGVTHGWWTPLHHAAKHLRECQRSIMYGHTHRPQVFMSGAADGHVRAAYGLPCLRTLDAEWCHGRPHGWAHGWGEVYVDDSSGRYNAQIVIVVDGHAIVDGRRYSGRAAR